MSNLRSNLIQARKQEILNETESIYIPEIKT